MNELAVIEKSLTSMVPALQEAIAPEYRRKVPAERIVRTLMVSLEKSPALAKCTMQSLVNAAWSAACLALEVDGVTGQAYLLPFAGKAQLVIGYKGFNTLAARSGYSISADVVRKGDDFTFRKGSNGFIKHSYELDAQRGDIQGAWAIAESKSLPSIIVVLTLDELMKTKAKSPGAKRRDSPWNEPTVGFPAMCEKTARRRLARSMPLNVMQLAAALDQHGEAGEYSYIDPEDRTVKIDKPAVQGAVTGSDDQKQDVDDPDIVLDAEPVTYCIIKSDGEIRQTQDKGQWIATIANFIKNATDKGLADFRKNHLDHLADLDAKDPDAADKVREIMADRLIELNS